MLRYELIDGEPRLVQQASRPMVYLDQCVWADVADDRDLGQHLVAILAASGATVALSAISLLELAKVRNVAQLATLASAMDALDVVFLESDPRTVVSREESYVARRGKGSPACDLDLLRLLERRAPTLAPPRPVALLFQLIDEGNVSDLHALGDRLHQAMTPLLLAARTDENAYARAHARWTARSRAPGSGPCTKALWEAVITFVIVHRDMELCAREWLDIVHTIVPVAYCDVVVLDKRWAEFVRQVDLRPGDAARVFRTAQLTDALAAVANWSKVSPPS